MAKRGRPATGEARKDQYRIRLNEKERKMLEYLAYEKDMSISEIFRKGILMQYNLEKFNWFDGYPKNENG